MQLETGALPTSKGTLVTCTSATGWRIKFFSVTNEDTSNTAKIRLYVNSLNSSRIITPYDLELPAGAQTVCANDVVLKPGDTIEGLTDLAGNKCIWQIQATEFRTFSAEI